jgi:regulator of protease activity HflC (stomatin/prohibitin superfamily)
MLGKIIGVIIATVIVGSFDPTRPWAVPFFIVALGAVFVVEGVRVVPQQNAWIVERLGKFNEVLEPGLNIIIPFIDRVAYRHSLKEVPLDVAEQVCITKDNTQLAVDGLIYYQVTDPRLASYGTSDYVTAIVQLAQTTLRSEVGKMELDQSLQSRDVINRQVVMVLDEAGRSWGVKVLRYEVKNLTPPEAILRAMQQQITAEREKRALIAKSEGEKQQEINVAEGNKQANILKSEGEKQSQINKAQGEATAMRLIAEATAMAVSAVAEALSKEGGQQAANLKIAEEYITAFKFLAKVNNTMIIPSNLADVSSIMATAMTVLDRAKPEGAPGPAPARA